MADIDQYLVYAILCALFALLVWGRWRYDVVAIMALMAAVLVGVVPARDAFSGFGHPATITVAAILVLSRALSQSGATDLAARLINPATGKAQLHIAALSGLGAAMSSMMNNVGTLGLLMPVAVQSAIKARRPAGLLLMPLSFGTILGGMVTLIGTPPNVIIAAFRGEMQGEAFGMFDFAPVGGLTALVGIVFIALIGWRLVPVRQKGAGEGGDMFDLEGFVTELLVPDDSPHIGKTLAEIDEMTADIDAIVVDLQRGEQRYPGTMTHKQLAVGDVLKIEASPTDLDKFISKLGLELARASSQKAAANVREDPTLIEAVVTPTSRLEGRTIGSIRVFSNRGIALLAVSRQGRSSRGRLKNFRLKSGDVLLLHGEAKRLPDAVAATGCLPLAQRDMAFGRRRHAPYLIAIFAGAIALTSFKILPITIALVLAVTLVVLFGFLPARELYDGIDWPIIVLLGALIPVGGALQSTGGTDAIAGAILALTAGLPVALVLVLLMVVTMTLSDILNNAATAVVMAPIAVAIAGRLGVNPDPFLMTVAVAASCAFLTPIGHQNNALIMGPGGFRFGDYWRLGLPLEILVVAVSIPLILFFWPL